MSKKHLNTNRQFMIGNGILAFAVIFVVVIFVYMSLRLSVNNRVVKYSEKYIVSVAPSVLGDSVQIFVNDSIVYHGIPDRPDTVAILTKFAEENSLLVVDMNTGYVSTLPLESSGESVVLTKTSGGYVKE